jgi:beta-lactamase class A
MYPRPIPGAIVRNRGSFSFLRYGSLLLIIVALVFTVFQLIRFSRLWVNFPVGMTIASVPVGLLDRQEAAERLLEVYSQPVELIYNEQIIQLEPGIVGFSLDTDAMLAAADQERTRLPFWQSFWNYLWDRPTQADAIPLSATFSEDRLRTYLISEIATRYDKPPTAAAPIPGTVNFRTGTQGTTMDIDRAVALIESAFLSTSQRSVTLPLGRTTPPRPTFGNLEVLLKQTIELSGYDGTIGLYIADLQTGQEINFIQEQGYQVDYPPDVAFTASSTIKIAIMISVFRRLGENPDAEIVTNLADMIAQSINPASDWLMANVLDAFEGPLLVTDDMRTLGFTDTFLAGYFYSGAPLLEILATSANLRQDISTDPDPYNQTTPSQIGGLLVDLYQCAQLGGGALLAAFPGEITQTECQTMINYLIQDRIALLIQAGVPDGTNVGHKHGWVPDIYGIIHDMSDAAIVFTPGGDYVMTVFMYHPVQIVFDPANNLVKDLSRAIYNYYNIP